MYAKIIDNNNLVRDIETNAILNTDMLAVRRHENRINNLQKESERDNELSYLKKELQEIKAMIGKLASKSC